MCVCLFIVTHSLLQCAAACVIAGPSSNVGIDRQPAQPSPAQPVSHPVRPDSHPDRASYDRVCGRGKARQLLQQYQLTTDSGSRVAGDDSSQRGTLLPPPPWTRLFDAGQKNLIPTTSQLAAAQRCACMYVCNVCESQTGHAGVPAIDERAFVPRLLGCSSASPGLPLHAQYTGYDIIGGLSGDR